MVPTQMWEQDEEPSMTTPLWEQGEEDYKDAIAKLVEQTESEEKKEGSFCRCKARARCLN